VLRSLARPLYDPPFRRFLGVSMVISASHLAALPFLVPYLQKVIHLGSSQIVWANAAIGASAMSSLLFWGRLTDRYGARMTLLGSIAVLATGWALFAVIPVNAVFGSWGAFAGAAGACGLLGTGFAGVQLGTTVRLLRIVPGTYRATYLATFAATLGLVNGAVAAASGSFLQWFPRELSIHGETVPTLRLWFLLVTGLLLLTMPLLRWLPPVAESSMYRAVKSLAQDLPGPLALPLVPIAAWLKHTEKPEA